MSVPSNLRPATCDMVDARVREFESGTVVGELAHVAARWRDRLAPVTLREEA